MLAPSKPEKSPRQEAHDQYTAIMASCDDDEERAAAAKRLALGDLFYLLLHVLRRGDMDKDWLFDRCRDVQKNPNGRLDLWSREHYKSTIITFGLTIQNILQDSEITVGIFSHSRPIAKGFLRQIKREFEGNATLKALFPEILWENPAREAPKWSEDDGIVVRRKSNPKESTVEAWGLVDGQPTGKHYSLLIYDDVVTVTSVTTPEMMAKTTEAWRISLNLGSDGGHRRIIGTRYHYNDTYGEIIRAESALVRMHPATVDGSVNGTPVLLEPEVLAAKRRDMGPYIFACQMLQDPQADNAQGFKEDWLCVWPARSVVNLNFYILVDPSSGKKKASGDYTSMMAVGVGANMNFYVYKMLRDRLNPEQRIDVLFDWHREVRPRLVGYEEYGMQSDIFYIRKRMNDENYRFNLIPLGGRISKPDRIKRMIPDFSQGRFLLPEEQWVTNSEGNVVDLVQTFIHEEFLPFPVGAHDDMMDALSRIYDVDPRAPGHGAAGGYETADTDYDMVNWR
jgi:hypothetical protein